MVLGLEKYLTRTFKQEDLDKAQAEENAAKVELESFDLSKDRDMTEVMAARDKWKAKKLRREEIEESLKNNKK